MGITINNLSYIHPDKEPLFHTINFRVLTGEKISLIGNNGSGKSTLLQVIAGKLQPSQGEVICSSKPYYIPQHFGQYDNLTISQALGVDEKLKALHAILEGDTSISNIECLNDDWSVESRVEAALQYWDLDGVELTQTMAKLSGGEKTKVFLSAIAIHSPEIILLDEPSNHLDQESRTLLYQFLNKSSKATILIVSQDRTLLNLLESTLELARDRVELYGGNYDFYEVQKEQKLNSLHTQLDENEKNLRQIKERARDIAEQKQKNDVRGKKQKQKAGIPRIAMGTFNEKHLLEHELKMLLHRYQFSNNMWDRRCAKLSGGEKMKLILCCLVISNNMPDILILDEPTNNLDIQSQKVLLSSIKNFGGAIIVVSHDQKFIDEIGIDHIIQID